MDPKVCVKAYPDDLLLLKANTREARKTPKVGEDDDGAQIEDFAKNAGAPNKEEPPRGMFEL